MFIVELENGVFIAPWEGDPGRTLVEANARRYRNEKSAQQALWQAREYREFKNATIRHVATRPI